MGKGTTAREDERMNPNTSIYYADFLAIDLEMTGLDPSNDDILEVAAVPIKNLELGKEDAFYSEIHPQKNIPAKSKAIHGLRGKELEKAPPLDSVLPQLFKIFTNRIIVSHNARIDLDFLRAKSKIAGVMFPSNPSIDTISLAKTLHPNKKKPNLDELLAEFGYNPRKGTHNALDDALHTAQVFLKMVDALKNNRMINTLGDLLRIGGAK